MTEPETPGFSVVDKRHAAQNPQDPVTPEPSEAAPPQAPSRDPFVPPSPDAPSANAEVGVSPDEEAPYTAADDESASRNTPDPAMLLSLAALSMPPREFVVALTGVFDGLARQNLGLLPNPLTGETRQDLPSAQLCIDATAFLLGKVEAGLPDGERREAQRRLNDLRINYLSQARP